MTTVQELSLFVDVKPAHHVHRDDPDTSRIAAKRVDYAKQAIRVLSVYADGVPITDAVAYQRAGFAPGVSARRCSDLRRAGLIAPTGEKGATPSGNPARLSVITDAGRSVLAARSVV